MNQGGSSLGGTLKKHVKQTAGGKANEDLILSKDLLAAVHVHGMKGIFVSMLARVPGLPVQGRQGAQWAFT